MKFCTFALAFPVLTAGLSQDYLRARDLDLESIYNSIMARNIDNYESLDARAFDDDDNDDEFDLLIRTLSSSSSQNYLAQEAARKKAEQQSLEQYRFANGYHRPGGPSAKPPRKAQTVG